MTINNNDIGVISMLVVFAMVALAVFSAIACLIAYVRNSSDTQRIALRVLIISLIVGMVGFGVCAETFTFT